MKRALGWMSLVALIVTGIGCSTCDCPKCRGMRNGCGPLGGVGSGHVMAGGGLHERMYGGPGPMTPTVVYPYYTTRGPRDFLSSNPRGIGP